MHYIRHYYHSGSRDPNFDKFLEECFNIPCEKRMHADNNTRFTYLFDVPENHPRFEELLPYLPIPTSCDKKIVYDENTELVLLTHYPQYSEQEYKDAQWLSVRSCFSKVFPENLRDVTKGTCTAYQTSKGYSAMRHTYLIGNYLVKKPVKWGKRFFAAGAYVSEYDLFCSQEARKIMELSGLNGVEYEPVRKKSTGEEFSDIYRLNVLNVLPDRAIIPISDMDTYICDQCGMRMLGYRDCRGQYGIQRDSVSNNLDFYITQPLFTANATAAFPVNGFSKLIVSQRFYRLVLENKMDRSLIFEPISIV